jgi:hypothetical protein
LHSQLVSLNSAFKIAGARIDQNEDVYHIELIEVLEMFGRSDLKQAEEYPLIPAARWALSNSSDMSVRGALQQYIVSATEDVNRSILNGVEIDFRLHHSIDFAKVGTQFQMISDTISDREVDNGEGFDNVSWTNGVFARSRPDLTLMPDYVIYHMPVEELGQQLLDDFAEAYAGASPTPNAITSFTYGRTAAGSYARTYTSNTPYTTCTNIYQQTSYYNPVSYYATVWAYAGCNDCADYVSQALRAGGFSTDSTWKYSGTDYSGAPGSYGWRVFDFLHTTWPNGTPKVGLAYYLQTTKNAVVVYTAPTSLLSGDLMYTDALHVVMVTDVAPIRFSGHTNDRMNYPWSSGLGLNHYWHIKDTVP